MSKQGRGLVTLVVLSVALVAACSGTGAADPQGPVAGSGASAAAGQSGAGAGGEGGAGAVAGAGGAAGAGGSVVNLGGMGGEPALDPNTCEGAAALKSYVGCDYWPTVTANVVWSVFDFVTVVVNAGSEPAEVNVSRGGKTVATVTVAPDSVEKIYLDWVFELKGSQYNNCGVVYPSTQSAGVVQGAYHLVSDRPVSVYQFSALEYEGKGGPPGKDWSTCPGLKACSDPTSSYNGKAFGCFSFSNDAALLLPSTALTGNYRVSAPRSYPDTPQAGGVGSFFSITGVVDGTQVKVKMAPTAQTYAGSGIGAAGPGDTASFQINQGDVLQFMGHPGAELSGSQIQADHPVQVIAGNPCNAVPEQLSGSCDHLEQTMLPTETLGKHYVVAPATGPKGDTPGQVVRLLGNVDGTTLTYKGTPPEGAPSKLDAGQLVELGMNAASFEVEGDHEFSIALFMPSGTLLDPQGKQGDPSMSVSVAVEQFRTKYVFLAPEDYDINVADVIAPAGAKLTLDGQPVTAAPTPIDGTSFEVWRLTLSDGQQGAHVLTSDQPVGLQVMGYGVATSYQYPGGANLSLIAPPPPEIQ